MLTCTMRRSHPPTCPSQRVHLCMRQASLRVKPLADNLQGAARHGTAKEGRGLAVLAICSSHRGWQSSAASRIGAVAARACSAPWLSERGGRF